MTGDAPRGRVRPLDVLVVEDERFTREILEILLADLGHQVTSCTNGQQAIDLCLREGHRFSVVLMDIQMPVMDGLEATRRLRADPRTADMAIICISAQATDAVLDEGLRAGCDCYLTKPVHDSQIFQAVTETLRRKGRLGADEIFG